MIEALVAMVALATPADDLNTVMAESTVQVNAGASQGSGFFTSPKRVLTAAHVVDGERTVVLTFAPEEAKESVVARVVHQDSEADIAVLHVEAGGGKPMHFTSGASVRGSDAFVLGAPEGQFRVTAGTILPADAGGQVLASARVFPGNSGGPMVDGRGRVIGMVTQRTTPANEAVAVDASTLQRVLASAPDSSGGLVVTGTPEREETYWPWVVAALLVLGGVAALASSTAWRPATRPAHLHITLD